MRRPSARSSATRTYGSGSMERFTISSCPVIRRCTSMTSPPSRSMRIHFARRRAPVMVRPVIACANVARSGVSRFLSRRTCAPVIRAPVNSARRSRTTVSTSGSSGTRAPAPHLVPPLPRLGLDGERDIECQRPLHRLNQERDQAWNLFTWRLKEEFVVYLQDEA